MTRDRLPLYWRALRLKHLRPNGWQRALLLEGVLAVAVVLVLADAASAWTIVVLPATVALVVKAHDLLAGWLGRETANGARREPDAVDGAGGG